MESIFSEGWESKPHHLQVVQGNNPLINPNSYGSANDEQHDKDDLGLRLTAAAISGQRRAEENDGSSAYRT